MDVDFLGFNFCKNNPRYVRLLPSGSGMIPDFSYECFEKKSVEASASTSSNRPILKVGVFENDMPQNIITRVYNHDLDVVQLNGNESSVMCENLLSTLIPDIQPKIRLMKKIDIFQSTDFEKCNEFKGVVSFFLFDIKRECVIKGEKCQDYDILADYHGEIPFFITGNIFPKEAFRIKNIAHDKFVGVDIDVNFEIREGVKDVDKVKSFIMNLKI